MNEKQSRIAIYIIIIVTAFCLFPLSHLKFDFNIEKLFPINDQDVVFFQKYQEQFQSQLDDEAIIIGLENSGGIFRRDFLEKTDSLSKYIEKLKHIEKVYSLTNANLIYFKGDQFNARPLIHIYQPGFYREDSINLFESKEYRDLLVSKSGKSIAIVAFNTQHLKDKEKDVLLESIKNKINLLGFEKTHIAAKIRFERTYLKEIKQNLLIYLVISFLLLGVSLFIFYKSIQAILFPILIIGISIIWTLSLMATLGQSLDMISSLLPLLLVFISIPNSIQFVSRYKNFLKAGLLNQNALEATFKEIGPATLFLSVSKAFIFFTLIITNISSLRNFGLFCGIGILLSYFLTVILFLAYYRIYSIPEISSHDQLMKRLEKLLRFLFIKSIKNKYRIIGISTLLIIVSGYYISKIEIKGKLVNEIPRSSSLLEDYNFMEKDFYGTRRFELALIVSSPGNSFFDRSLLKKVEEIEIFLKDSCNVSYIISPISLFKAANKAYKGGDNVHFILPDSQDEINQYTENIMQTQYADDMQRHILQDGSKLRISGRMGDLSIKEFKMVSERFERYFVRKNFSSVFSYKITGSALIFDKITISLLKNLLISLLAAFLIISCLSFYLLRNGSMFFIFLTTNLISMLLIAGFMSLCEIYLKPGTAIIFFVAFVLVIDTLILFMNQIKLQLAMGLSLIYAVKRTYLITGKMTVITICVLLIGIVNLLFGGFGGAFNTGILISVSLLLTLLINLTLLPVFLILFYKKYNTLKSKK